MRWWLVVGIVVLSVIDAQTMAVVATVPVGSSPAAIAVGADGARIYVPLSDGSPPRRARSGTPHGGPQAGGGPVLAPERARGGRAAPGRPGAPHQAAIV
jgi:hypothetical protein